MKMYRAFELPRRLSVLLAVLLAVLLVTAAVPPVFGDPPGEADHDELRAMLVTVTKAINEGDFDSLEPILAEKFIFTTADQVTLTSLAAIREHYENVFQSGDYPVTALQVAPEATIKTEFVDDNNGYCYGTAVETYTLKTGKPLVMHSTWTGTVTKTDGKWKLSTAHVGIHFMENAIIDTLNATLKWAMVGGLGAGCLVGLLLAKLSGRRRRA